MVLIAQEYCFVNSRFAGDATTVKSVPLEQIAETAIELE